MKLKSSIAVLAAGAIASFGVACTVSEVSADQTASPQKVQTTTSAKTKQAEADEQKVQFICGKSYAPDSKEYLPTTFAWNQRGKMAIVRWKSDWAANAGYPPQKRCDEVSPRFEQAYKNGSLEYLTNGRRNNEKVICAARESGGGCDTLLFTLRPEDRELLVLRQLNEIIKGNPGGGPVQHSQPKHDDGTRIVYLELDLETFLSTAPVEQE